MKPTLSRERIEEMRHDAETRVTPSPEYIALCTLALEALAMREGMTTPKSARERAEQVVQGWGLLAVVGPPSETKWQDLADAIEAAITEAEARGMKTAINEVADYLKAAEARGFAKGVEAAAKVPLMIGTKHYRNFDSDELSDLLSEIETEIRAVTQPKLKGYAFNTPVGVCTYNEVHEWEADNQRYLVTGEWPRLSDYDSKPGVVSHYNAKEWPTAFEIGAWSLEHPANITASGSVNAYRLNEWLKERMAPTPQAPTDAESRETYKQYLRSVWPSEAELEQQTFQWSPRQRAAGKAVYEWLSERMKK